MKLLPIIIAASLTACAAPDRCWTERETIKTCVELRKTDPRIRCECTSTASEPRDAAPAPVVPPPKVDDPVVIPPVDHDDHSEDPDRDPEKYDYWKETRVWE